MQQKSFGYSKHFREYFDDNQNKEDTFFTTLFNLVNKLIVL